MVLVDRSIVWLDEPGAADARLSGAKASNLAAARAAGLPVYDGFVIVAAHAAQVIAAHGPTASAGSGGNGSTPRPLPDPALPPDTALFDAWTRLTGGGRAPLVVRSSSVLEDSSDSSMAGRFLTVLDVSCWTEFLTAVADVLASAGTVLDNSGTSAPMAVLVQPMGDAVTGGVLFGIDPLTGDESSFLVSYAPGAPEQIVSGAVDGTQMRISRVGARRSPSGSSLGHRDRRRLARLARCAERLFGGPQDIEWLIDSDGTLRLLQSRPITASAVPVSGGHLLGSGPVSETFPDPLTHLERDLWVEPLDTGVREALRISGTVSARGLSERFVLNVGGRVAVDLEALGIEVRQRSWWQRLDPRPPARRVRAAWRIGRLRVALPAIAHDLVHEVDEDLESVGPLERLGDFQLLTVLDNACRILAGLHAHEVTAGFFLGPGTTTATGASVALTTVARDRLDGLSDAQIVARHPVTLALIAPRIGVPNVLPATPPVAQLQRPAPTSPAVVDDSMGVAREALRLRVRWAQELGAQVSMELGRRLCSRGQLATAADVRHLGLADLRACVDSPGSPADVAAETTEVAPLPARFRLARDGSVVPELVADHDGSVGPIGVSGGRVVGVVTHDPSASAARILVVHALDPSLAGVIGAVAGLISDSGSPLSHLAILAREFGVPAVAAMTDATERLHDGDVVLLDGTAGTVELLTDEPPTQLARADEQPTGRATRGGP